jgi:alpha-galactosidase
MTFLRTLCLAAFVVAVSAKPLKVFIFAGQSNMEGQAEVQTVNKSSGKPLNGTLKYQLTDPRTKDLFAQCWDNSKNDWTVLDDIKVWFNEAGSEQGVNGSKIPSVNDVDASFGSLTVGYGCGGPKANKKNVIGPEYGFGFGMHTALKGEQILIVKTAWGGKTLAGDYRPPSSTTKSDQWCTGDSCKTVGHFYKMMLQDVAAMMEPGVIAQMFPDLKGLEPEISGFGWFQGWNDGCDLNQTAAYETNMVNLIKDLRKEWKSPNLPVTIAASGFDGFYGEEATRSPKGCWDDSSTKTGCNCANDRGCRRLDVVLSQFAAANATRHPELNGNVATMETRGFWRDPQYSPNKGQGYHFWHNAETYFLVGQAMAKGMLSLMGMGDGTPNVAGADTTSNSNERPYPAWKDQCVA